MKLETKQWPLSICRYVKCFIGAESALIGDLLAYFTVRFPRLSIIFTAHPDRCIPDLLLGLTCKDFFLLLTGLKLCYLLVTTLVVC